MSEPLRTRSGHVIAPEVVRTPLDGDGVHWRPIVPDDVDAIAALEVEVAAVDHPHYRATRESIATGLGLSTVDLARDTLLAVDDDGTVLAWGHAWLPSGAQTLQRVILIGAVRPSARRRGFGTALAAWQVDRGLQLLAETGSTLPAWLVANAEADRGPAVDRFIANGLSVARYFLTLHRELADPSPAFELAPSLRLEPYREELAEATRLAKNDAFRDHWGAQPTDAERWAGVVGAEVFTPQFSFVVLDERDEVVAFILTESDPGDWPGLGRSSVYISLLGVRREARGRRLAPALLAAAIRAAHAAGLEIAVLDVDHESPTGAVGLYTRMGFTEAHRSVQLVREC